jgi:hypothetical protein
MTSSKSRDDSLFFRGPYSLRFQSSATKSAPNLAPNRDLVKQRDRSTKRLAPEFFANRIRRVRHAMDREQVVAQFAFPLPAEAVDHLDRL